MIDPGEVLPDPDEVLPDPEESISQDIRREGEGAQNPIAMLPARPEPAA